ncbi:hypothetical protein M0R45_028195 [Rubus argutus]|uniref:MADS-box domain-containing protein n=1 Tax=Rubus argutus TaxID=59490 RepID=A0AAW1W6Q3_RUBAR
MGLKKIEIKKISHKNALNATFKKRRQCVFHKADELCSKTGAQIAIIVFSPANNPSTFGHPWEDLVIDRYYYPSKESTLNDTQILDENHGLGSVIDEEKVESWLD